MAKQKIAHPKPPIDYLGGEISYDGQERSPIGNNGPQRPPRNGWVEAVDFVSRAPAYLDALGCYGISIPLFIAGALTIWASPRLMNYAQKTLGWGNDLWERDNATYWGRATWILAGVVGALIAMAPSLGKLFNNVDTSQPVKVPTPASRTTNVPAQTVVTWTPAPLVPVQPTSAAVEKQPAFTQKIFNNQPDTIFQNGQPLQILNIAGQYVPVAATEITAADGKIIKISADTIKAITVNTGTIIVFDMGNGLFVSLKLYEDLGVHRWEVVPAEQK